MLRTIDFREALQLRRDKQKAEGTIPSLDFDVPQLTDYQVAKDIWFWFARQQTTLRPESLPAAATPHVGDSVTPSDASSASPAGGLSLALSEHDKAVCSRLGQALRHVPWVVRFLLLFHAAVATTPDEERLCLSKFKFGSWAAASPPLGKPGATTSTRLVLLLFNALELNQTLRDLVQQDLCIARKQLEMSGQAAASEVSVFFEDFKVFGCCDVLRQLAALTPSVEGGSSFHVDVAENVDGDRVVVAVRASAQTTAATTHDSTVRVGEGVCREDDSVAFDQSVGGGASSPEKPARNAAAKGPAFTLFTRETEWSEVDDDEGEASTAAAVSASIGEAAAQDPVCSLTSLDVTAALPTGRGVPPPPSSSSPSLSTRDFFQVFAEYRDKLYSGRYEFMEDIGVVECSK